MFLVRLRHSGTKETNCGIPSYASISPALNVCSDELSSSQGRPSFFLSAGGGGELFLVWGVVGSHSLPAYFPGTPLSILSQSRQATLSVIALKEMISLWDPTREDERAVVGM